MPVLLVQFGVFGGKWFEPNDVGKCRSRQMQCCANPMDYCLFNIPCFLFDVATHRCIQVHNASEYLSKL